MKTTILNKISNSLFLILFIAPILGTIDGKLFLPDILTSGFTYICMGMAWLCNPKINRRSFPYVLFLVLYSILTLFFTREGLGSVVFFCTAVCLLKVLTNDSFAKRYRLVLKWVSFACLLVVCRQAILWQYLEKYSCRFSTIVLLCPLILNIFYRKIYAASFLKSAVWFLIISGFLFPFFKYLEDASIQRFVLAFICSSFLLGFSKVASVWKPIVIYQYLGLGIAYSAARMKSPKEPL